MEAAKKAGDLYGGRQCWQIGLDLVVNKNEFDKQMKGIQGLAKKAGAALAAAFAVKKLVDFGAQCIALGSDLQEVQNVVDVTFPRMSRQVDEFAKNAAGSFGLSETMAKKFTGTFGAMAKAFGFGEQQAYEMATALTGLSGDVASFYNISQDEAYTKLKSVFTGETESLKDLGVVMTRTALDQYAMANGFGKTTQAMTEAEKVAVRYKFVTDQLSGASGDFIRTSDGWANQVRVLKLQFDSLKATIGQGLINVLTPVIKVINTIIGKLMSLANAFKAFTELITGKKGSGGGASVASADMEAVAESADHAGAAMGGAGGAAKKAAKDIKGAATGIDELNIIQAPDDSGSGSGGSGGGAAGGYAADEFDMGEIDTSPMDELDSKYQGLIDRAKELAALFQTGFKFGFGDTSVFDTIRTSIESIGKSLSDIFTDARVVNSAKHFADLLDFNLGRVAGSVASIGATIADNLLGGISLYLESNSQRIKDYLVTMFDIGSEITNIIGSFTKTLAEIFSIFRSDTAKQITADIIGIFSSAFTGLTELLGKIGRDILNVLAKPIIDNKDAIKEAIQGLLDAIQPIISKIKELLDRMFDGLNTAYDTYAKPVFDALAQALSDAVAWCLENTGTIEAITAVVAAFFAAWEVIKLGEFIINAGGVIGAFQSMIAPVTMVTTALLANAKAFIANTAAKIADKAETVAIVAMYAKDFAVAVASSVSALVKQAAQFAINTAAKIADAIAQAAMTAATVAWNAICAVATALTTALGAAIAFLTSPIGLVVLAIAGLIAAGVLLYKHWDEVKAFATSVWNSIKDTISSVIEAVKTFVSEKLEAIKETWERVWGGIKQFVSTTWTGIKNVVSNAIKAVKSVLETIIKSISDYWETKWNAIKFFATVLWTALQTSVQTIFSAIRDTLSNIWESIKRTVEDKWNAIKTWFEDTWNKIFETASTIFTNVQTFIATTIETIRSAFEEKLNLIKSKWDEVWDGLKKTTEDIFGGIWDFIKGIINNILSGVEIMANGVVRAINKMIDALNNLSFDIPDWVPEFGGKSFGLDIPTIPEVSIPRLAKGGFVKANTPQLAMIGDNRHYGEIVAPEDKMQAMVDQAVAMASANNGMSAQYLIIMIDLLKKIIELIENLDLTVTFDTREIKKKLADLEKRSGYTLKTT